MKRTIAIIMTIAMLAGLIGCTASPLEAPAATQQPPAAT